jgi:zinc D-Ala-D-Ala carboxypeptidase
MKSFVATGRVQYKGFVKPRTLRGPRRDTSPRRAPGDCAISTTLLRHARNHCRHRARLGIFALVFIFGVGWSLLGLVEKGIAAPIASSTFAAEWSWPFDSATKVSPSREDEASKDQETKEQARKPPGLTMACDGLDVLVDRKHSLSPDYVPSDLVPLQEDHGVPTLGSEVLRLRHGAAENLGDLIEDAAADAEELVVASAYRSYEQQQLSHQRLISVFGADAFGMSAQPGHSQHQLGTAVDFTNAAAGYLLWRSFANTSAYSWLEHHAWEYGFVLSYPRGKKEQTGYQWEPWHYRYVGVKEATRLQQSDLSLQEFLEREGNMTHC